MANNFLIFKGFKVGKSLIEKDSEKIIEKYMQKQKNIIVIFLFLKTAMSQLILKAQEK